MGSVLDLRFALSLLTWPQGFLFHLAFFKTILTTHTFPRNPIVPVIGTLCSGLAYLGTPFSMRIISRYPKFRTPMMWFGLAMCVLSCLAASFVNSVCCKSFRKIDFFADYLSDLDVDCDARRHIRNRRKFPLRPRL